MLFPLLLALLPQVDAPPQVHAAYVDPASLVIDGDPSEWRGTAAPEVVIDRLVQFIVLSGREPGELWTGPEDASVRLWLGWNEEDLVLAGEVWDEVTDHDPSRWFHGDSLELFLNFGDREAKWGPDDYQVMLAPDWPERSWGVYPHEGQTRGGPLASDAGFGGIEITCHPFEAGYRFEARIPWRNFDGWVPEPGSELPFNLAVCDRDGRRAGGASPLDSYGTWTGEHDIAMVADRRGTLVLDADSRTGVEREGAEGSARGGSRPLLLVLLACTYAFALLTRRVWRRPMARRLGVAAALGILLVSAAVAASARISKESGTLQRRTRLEEYWTSFERLLQSGTLGHPEPAALVEDVRALLAGEGIAPVAPLRLAHLMPEGARRLPRERTTRRGIPFVPFVVVADEGGEGAEAQPARDRRGRVLRSGESCVLPMARSARVAAVHLVTRVSDRRYLDVAGERPVLSVELLRDGAPVAAREVRHRQDLHHEEDEHRDHPGLEPAFDLAEGRLGSAHGDALLLELDGFSDVDQLVVRHLGLPYDVRLVAVGLKLATAVGEVPEGLQLNPDDEWEWSGWREEVEAEVVPWNRTPKGSEPGRVRSPLRLGTFPIGSVSLLDTTPPARPTRWESLPLLALAASAPFLVAIFAEWLATRRRIRGKLAVGFAVSSAVPLLALTLLLEASLSQAHESGESERAQSALLAAEQELEETERELEREAQRLLRIAELERAAEGAFPVAGVELEGWWGASEGALRLLEHVDPDGRRARVGSGPGWSQVPDWFELRGGLIRPWGRLLVAGVARTASGAERPLAVLVARPPRLPDSTESSADQVRLIGAGRDPAPTVADLTSTGLQEIRRPVFGPNREKLAGVLVVSQRERGVPVLGDFSLTELLLAAGLTALFTALLFAGILTGHIVGPIERLDRAVREGSSSHVEPAAPDEIGHLTSAIRSFTTELSQRVSQLETLQRAQEELSSRLDFERAREAVLAFFREQTGATSAWLAWAGGPGEEPRLFGEEGRDLPVPEGAEFFAEALVAEAALQRGPGELPQDEAERLLLGRVERVVSLPLLVAGECRGAIVFGLRSADAPLDLAFLGAASGQAAIVLENARLYHQAVSDAVTGFLSDPGFRQRLTEEIQRAQDRPGAGVVLVQARLTDLPEDDELAAVRMREAARRMRLAVPGMALFGRSGASDLKVAVPWSDGAPSFDALEARIAERLTSGPWPDGEPVRGLHTSHAAWPNDGPSGRFVTHVLEERLVEVQSSAPIKSGLADVLPRDFIAESPILIELLDTVRRIAEQEATVLISGETGVGKDRIAELVHAWSPRASGPLVHVHCPSLSEALIEDELFGHEIGAFTGAHTRRVGPFEYASGGTLVLDEIGGLSHDGQVALLRLLETREVVPLGATEPVPIDVRVVATTSRDLALDAERGDFRRDLYFRLNVAQVAVPPLRLRRPDIPALVETAVRRFNASSARPVTGVDPRVLDVLFDHPWPGNVRELDNVLSRALIGAAGAELGPEHLSLEPEEPSPGPGGPTLNARQQALLEGLSVGARIGSTEHADRFGISSRTALRDLVELVDLGLLGREGQKRGTRFRRLENPKKATFGQ